MGLFEVSWAGHTMRMTDDDINHLSRRFYRRRKRRPANFLKSGVVSASIFGLISICALLLADVHVLKRASHAPVAPPLGAFLGSGAEGVARIPDFQEWLGTTVKVGHTYLPGEDWVGIEGPPEIIDPWARWRAQDPSRLLVINVPMVGMNEAGLPDAVVSSLLRGGAAGAFDKHFERLAERLVKAGVPDSIIVPGWEMNGTTYSGRCGPNPAMWKIYWRRIVTTMRSVTGARFQFDFTASRGRDAVPWTDCYPGDDVVDIIGSDSYDQPAGKSFSYFINEPYGLKAQADFAAARRKPLSFPEWGLFRNSDNPDYVEGMYDWMMSHNVLYQTVTDYCPHGVWRCKDNPRSSRAFRRLFGGRSGETTTPTPSPTCTTPAPSVSTSPPVPSTTPPAKVDPTPTPTPTPSSTASPTPSTTPTPTPTPTVTPAPATTPSPTPTVPPTPAAPTLAAPTSAPPAPVVPQTVPSSTPPVLSPAPQLTPAPSPAEVSASDSGTTGWTASGSDTSGWKASGSDGTGWTASDSDSTGWASAGSAATPAPRTPAPSVTASATPVPLTAGDLVPACPSPSPSVPAPTVTPKASPSRSIDWLPWP
ncbi:glycosyl hydrolase [Spirillospora sp. NPDC047279]|uniref:glycoside hydrolase family 26 protein n=1 Tax=Spirillospora sp. NPDC047279 TaxID=3155478 RepID=UPI003400EC72